MLHPLLRRGALLMACAGVLAFGGTALAQDATPEANDAPALAYDPGVCADYNDGGEIGPECLAMMEAYPRPPVTAIDQDRRTMANYSFWRIGPEETALFGAPGGAQVGTHPAGYNFVSVIAQQDGWIQIEGGNWIREADASIATPSYFTGVTFDYGLEHPFGIVLDLSMIYTSAYPGGPADTDTGRFIERYELVNLFAEAEDDEGWAWYMIGPNQWVKQTFLSIVHRTEVPDEVEGRWVAVDLYEQTLIAYEDDTPVFATLVASGIPPYETVEGLFTVWARVEADPMSGATGAPEAYALQRVPWVMYFDGGRSLHGTYWHNLFGYRQSHGCVNLTISDARWVYEWMNAAEDSPVGEDGYPVNYVYVHSSGSYGSGVIRGQ